jgi:hypothetical protein
MRLVLTSVLLGLAWFGAINVAASIVAWAIGRWAIDRGVNKTALLLSVRFLPALASAVFVLALFLPSHWRFEERQAEESFGFVLVVLAVMSAAILIRSAMRALRTSWRGHRLVQAARQSSTRIENAALALPGLPGISLAGIVRTEVLVGSDALKALTRDELAIAISHENAHRRSLDNVKRFLMFCSPDVFGPTAVARRLESAWQAEAEIHADADAVNGDARRAVLLASALVKVAKLHHLGPIVEPSRAWSAFHVPTLLETRVRRLVGARVPEHASRPRVWLPMTIAGVASAVVVWLADFSYTLHLVTEAMVTGLP